MPHTGETPSSITAPPRPTPEFIGPFRVRGVLGEGGFGTVYLGEQESPVRRQVAIKLLRTGPDATSIVARFHRERQALAVMEHPNIAKIIDADAMPDGRPYVVMELVRGRPITAFCDAESLSVRDRLDLFAQVCAAVQHAHTKGVIHRDLKPSNILVAQVDGKAIAKVIDFGIAKPTEPHEGEQTVYTQLRQLLGTPDYMSPEQASGSLDLDTRTDIYSLGVVLYELMVGELPHGKESLRDKPPAHVQRVITEKDPPRPSTRLSASQDTRIRIAELRATDPVELTRQLKGELDWVVMKCLAKEPERRYQSAAELAADVRRYLNGEAVLAAPPSTSYRLHKFVARNRGPVFGAAAAVLALVLGLAGTTFYLLEARAANAELKVAIARAQEEERKATREAARATAFTKLFVEDVLGSVDPRESEGREITVREVLDRTAPLVDAVEDPVAQVMVMVQIGRMYATLGKHREAHALLTRALAQAESDSAISPDGLGRILLGLAQTCLMLETEGFGEAHARRARGILAELHGETHDVVIDVDRILATLLHRQGRVVEAMETLMAALARLGEAQPPGSETLHHANLLAEYANQLVHLGRVTERYEVCKRVLEIRRRLDAPSLDIASALADFGEAASAAGKLDEALAALTESTEISRRVKGEGSASLAQKLAAIGAIYMRAGRPAEGEAPVREAVSIYERALGPTHEGTLRALNTLGAILAAQGRFDEAAEYFRGTYDVQTSKYGPDDSRTITAQSLLGGVLAETGDHAESERLLLDAYERLTRTGVSPAVRRITARRLATLYEKAGRADERDRWQETFKSLSSPG